MVVLAPGTEIRAEDIPQEILGGPPTLLPVLVGGRQGALAGGGLGTQEVEFILRGLMDLRLQVEELRRRPDERAGRVQVIEVPETALTGIEVEPGDGKPIPEVIYRAGMTMADMERAAIVAALDECQGNRRKAAANLGIGERTLYRKNKEYR